MIDYHLDPTELPARAAVDSILGRAWDLPELEGLRQREERRPGGGRVTVLRAIDDLVAEVEIHPPPPEVPPAPPVEEVPPLPTPAPLPPAPWAERSWRGHRLYRCRFCPHQTFDVALAYQHARAAHPTTKE